MKKYSHIWVVEMRNEKSGKWEPTVGVGLTRNEAKFELARWRQMDSFDKFRISKYINVDAKL